MDKAGHFISLAHIQRPDDFELSILMGQINYHKAYFIETEDFLPASLQRKVSALADSEGYVQGGMQRYAIKF